MENSTTDLNSCPPGLLPASAITKVQRTHRLFLKALEARLGEALQGSIGAALAETRQSTMAQCLSVGELGAYLIALDIAPSKGHAALSFSPSLLRAVLDILLARPSGARAAAEAHVTEIEIHILRDFFEAFTGTLRKAWGAVFPVAFNRQSTGVDDARQILGAVAGDPVLVIGSRLRIGGVDHTFDLALPGFLIRLADLRSTQSQPSERANPQAKAILAGPLRSAVVELEAVLRGPNVRMGDLLAMKAGQILMLGLPVESGFDCLANGKPHFAGEMLAGGNRHCLRIHSLNS